MWEFLNGVTSKSIDVNLVKASDGTPMTGLVFNTAGLTLYSHVPGGAAPAAISLVTQTVAGAWVSGGFKELDATNTPGLYRLDLPNAVLALGAGVIVYLMFNGAAVRPTAIAIVLKAFDPNTKGAINIDNLDAALSVIAAYIDTEIGTLVTATGSAAIGAAVLAAAAAAPIAADVKKINAVTINGTGVLNDEFQP